MNAILNSPEFVFRLGSPVENASGGATLSTTMVRSVGLSDPTERCGFSVVDSGLIDSPVVKCAPIGQLRTSVSI